MPSLRTALAGGGGLLAATVFLLGNLTGEQAKPVERVIEPIVASSPADKLCPDGWTDTSTSDKDTVVLSCSRDGWLVILRPDSSFDHAWLDGAPDFTADEKAVPNWSR